jgi:uncharacterized Zn-binding protein involved in type VI secretion
VSEKITFLAAVGSATAGDAVNCSAAKGMQIQVYSASTSSSTVLIQGSNVSSSGPWVTLATISDVALAGNIWQGAAMTWMRVNPSVWSSGSISAYGQTSDVDYGAWHVATQGSTTPVALTAVALTVAQLTDSGLTTTRVPYASTAGLLIDAATFTFTTATGELAATQFKGGQKDKIAAKLTNGAIAAVSGSYAITKGSALASSTLATPVTTDDDGIIMRFVSTTAYAHVISVASGKINGGSLTTITFTSAAIGDSVTVMAYQGIWYTIGTTGTITIS